MRTKSFLILLPLLALVSCQQEEMEYIQDSPEKGQEIRITAGFGDADPSTRTSISSNGKVLWSPGEAINIFYGPSGESSGSKFVSQNTQAASTAVFTGTITAFTGVTEAGDPLSFWGIYPYSESNRCNGSSVVLELPVVQEAVEENFKDNTVPMVAQASGLALPFYNVCSMIRFSLVNSDITKVTVRGNNGETVAGRVSVSMGSDGKPVWSDTEGEGSKSVTLNGPSGGTFEAGKFYYIAILPGEFPNGYTMEFYTSDGRYGERVRGSSITFSRNGVTKQADRDEGVTWTSMVEPEYVDLGLSVLWATCNIGANSPEEIGDYYAWGEVDTYYHQKESGVSWKPEKEAGYAWPSYKYYDGPGHFSKYAFEVEEWGWWGFDGKTVLDIEDDVANVKYGGLWRMPTRTEFEELANPDNCSWYRVTRNGVPGFAVYSKKSGYTDKQIFLPLSNKYYRGTELIIYNNYTAFYYSSSLAWPDYSNSAAGLFLNNDNLDNPYTDIVNNRYEGAFVRPVKGGSIYLNKNLLDIEVDDEVLLTATVFPESTSNQDVTWMSNNTSIATVSATGKITGVSCGTATITATSVFYGKTTSCTVTVSEKHEGVQLWEDGPFWATCNIGAETEQGMGALFSWGNINGTTSYAITDAGYDESKGFNLTGDIPANSTYYDAASYNWCRKWRMPTAEEFSTLINADNSNKTTISYNYSVFGLIIRGTGVYNEASIFLPFYQGANTIIDDEEASRYFGLYWSSTYYDGGNAYSLYGHYDWNDWDERYSSSLSQYNRSQYCAIRPVHD